MTLLQNAIEQAVASIQSLHALAEPLQRSAALVEKCLLGGGKLLVCGNGGSAADGADFSTEFTCRFVGDRNPFPAMNLSVGGSLLTATANDYHFDEIFARQVTAFGKPGDVLVGITTSGNSRNVIRAFEEANRRGVHTIALLGKNGGAARGIASVELIVPETSVTARIQEAHKFLLHTLCEMVEPALQNASK